MRLTVSVVSQSLSLGLALALALVAGAAAAQNGPPPPPGGGNFIGTGAGRMVFFSPAGKPFRSAPGEPYPVVAWFAQADADKDGKISHDEFLNDSVAFFNALDVNRDHYINSPENTTYETRVAPEITRIDPRIAQPKNFTPRPDPETGTVAPGDARYIQTIQGASQYGLIDEPQPIRAADANLDFRVSLDEWITASQQRFAILDRNGDDVITADELPKTPAQLALEAPQPDPGKGPGKKDKKKRFFGNNDN